MYDTVNMWLDWSKVGNYNLSTLTRGLTKYTEHKSNDYNSITGNLNNYKIGAFETGISFKGSLSKFYFNDNLHTLTRSGTQQAIEKLSDVLLLPIFKASITQVDLATHFIMKNPPSDYYNYLGEKRYFKRVQATKNTLYYNTKPRQLIFYDKFKEATSKNVIIPDVFKNENLLRYEIRHKGRLNKQFNLPEVTAFTLYDEKFYMNLIDIWVKEYFNIQKINRLTINNMDNIKTPKDAENMIFGLLLNQFGQTEIDNIIADMKRKNVYQDPKYYSRLKSKLKELANKPEISEKSELISELDKQIISIKQYYR